MTDQTQTETQTQGKRDLRQEITDRFVAALEQNRIPWERPWEENLKHGAPRNMASGKPYQGGNQMLLLMAQMDNAYADPRFGTIKQINELGGRVKKGEHGHPVELWKNEPFWERRDVTVTMNGRPVKVFDQRGPAVDVGSAADKKPTMLASIKDLKISHKGQNLSWQDAHNLDRVVSKTYVVFNAEQCIGLNLEPLPVRDNTVQPIERGENLMRVMVKDGVTFKQHAEAFYSPAKDEIYLPPHEAFKTQEGYYGTALHEIGHATGAAQRLNRVGITGGHRFGSEGYAKEELRAELFSTFMAAETGIPHDEEQHKAYVQSWAEVLKKDKNELFRAASEAGKAADYILAKERELQAEKTQTAEQIIEKQEPERPPTLRSSLEEAGWRFKPTTRSYEKAFLLTKDQELGGEFTHGKPVAEKILVAKTAAQGLVIEHGWDTVPVPGTTGVLPQEATRALDATAKDLLAKAHAHLGVTAVRGQNETTPQAVFAESQAPAERVPDEPKPAQDRADADNAPAKHQGRTRAETTTQRWSDKNQVNR
jgi:antirestriction protein ArdC